MKKVFAWIKAHPLTLVLIAGALILVFLLFGGSSGTAQTTVAGTTVDPNAAAEIASSTQLQTAQIQSSTALTGQANQQAFQLAEDQINANTTAYTTNVGAQVQLAGIGASQDVQLAGIQGQVQLADLQNQSNLAQAQVYSNIFTSQQQTQQTQYNDAAAVAINGQNVQGAVALAPYQVASTALSTGNLNLGTKDSYLNLPGISTGRATNYTPPGATAGSNSGFSLNVGSIFG